ncbi:hypothetical protein ACHAXR_011575 [Thalassiosira sp. AJA248-18]
MKSIILFLLPILSITNANKIIVNNDLIQETPKLNNNNNNNKLTNPFLSTTLSSKITSVSTDSDFDTERKSLFSETLSHFLTKIFKDQQVYHVKIISVNIFDDHILKNGQYVKLQQQRSSNGDNDDDAGHTLSFSTVVSAEYTNENDINTIANDSFHKMVMHVCDKFQSHLVQFMKDTGDPYFMNVESVVLGDFERAPVAAGSSGLVGAKSKNEVFGLSEDTVDTASIIAIVVGGIVFVVLAFASVKYYRKEKQLKEKRLRSKETESFNTRAISPANSLVGVENNTNTAILADDYSFSPFGSDNNCYNPGQVHPYTGYKDDPPIHTLPSMDEEEIAFSSVWPESAPPPTKNTLFPAPGATTEAKAILSYTEELNKLPKQHVFAPPGKIGVAIDVVNGQPVVHKVRNNSPLQNMLRANDIIVAIDDEDASCLSAADVTSLMVKRMDRVRKITFVRRD